MLNFRFYKCVAVFSILNQNLNKVFKIYYTLLTKYWIPVSDFVLEVAHFKLPVRQILVWCLFYLTPARRGPDDAKSHILNSLTYSNGAKLSTMDSDQDTGRVNCAEV